MVIVTIQEDGIQIGNNHIFDGSGQRFLGGGLCGGTLYWIPFQISDINYLSAGTHHISLNGQTSGRDSYSYVTEANLNIIVDPNGGIDYHIGGVVGQISPIVSTNISNEKISVENGKVKINGGK